MASTNSPPRVWFDQSVSHELIQQTAHYFFALRVVLGVMAWVYYNEVAGSDPLSVLPVHLLFVAYLAGNTVLCLRFRNGETSRTLLRADLLLNIGTATMVTALTGGLQSPLALIVVIKITGYLLVYGIQLTMLAAFTAIAIMGVVAAGKQLGWWQISVAAGPYDADIDNLFRLGLLAASLIGAPWLLRQVERKDRQLQVEVRRARAAVERERAAHAVSRALLAVNEAVSSATRLDDVLAKVVDVTPRVLGIEYCGVFLWSEEEAVYRGALVSGTDPAVTRQFADVRLAPADVPDFEWVRQLGHCAVVAARGIARLGLPEAPTLLMAPLRSGERFYGVLQFGRRDGRTVFTQNELLISDGIAAQTAVAIERARLIDESRRLGRAVESTGEGVVITDREGHIVYANNAFLRLFGYTWPELKGGDGFGYASQLPSEQLADIRRGVAKHSWHGEATGCRRDGSTFPMMVNVSTIRSAEDPFQGIVAIVSDMSAERALQERMQRADRLAAAGQMASGVAHEINNALVGILGQASMVRDTADAAELRRAMHLVERQGHRIADIVQQLLRFARPREPERNVTDLHQLVDETLELVAAEARLARVTCLVEAPDTLPVVMVDAKQIEQVLVNLFTNAIQAMQSHGGGTLRVRLVADASDVRIDVEDSGLGITSEHLGRVFDPFFTTKDGGTGLGLSVSFAIVRAHGGDLSVRSEPGQGTTFILKLPALTAVPVRSAGLHALLVDDDAAVAETLREMLTREGLSVHHAATGHEALEQAAQGSFDVVFLDVRLPDISGPEVYQRLAADHPELARRVVFVTGGLWRGESRGLREQLPPQPTLSKPCTAAQIREVLRLLRDSRAAA